MQPVDEYQQRRSPEGVHHAADPAFGVSGAAVGLPITSSDRRLRNGKESKRAEREGKQVDAEGKLPGDGFESAAGEGIQHQTERVRPPGTVAIDERAGERDSNEFSLRRSESASPEGSATTLRPRS